MILINLINQIHTQAGLTTSDTAIYKVFNITKPPEHISWVEYLKPSLDFLIALIGAFVLVWKYLTQKQKEFDERIIKSKRQAYAKFLDNFTETAV